MIFIYLCSNHFLTWNVRLLRLVIKIVPDKFSLPKPYAYIQSVLKSFLTNQDKNSFKIIINIMQCVSKLLLEWQSMTVRVIFWDTSLYSLFSFLSGGSWRTRIAFNLSSTIWPTSQCRSNTTYSLKGLLINSALSTYLNLYFSQGFFAKIQMALKTRRIWFNTVVPLKTKYIKVN